MTVRPSHPNPTSSLVDHSTDVSRVMLDRAMSSLLERHQDLANFICKVAGLLHDILKDTEAFKSYLFKSRSKGEETRHTGGSALLAFCAASQILEKNKRLLSDNLLRPYLPCLVFSIVASHHDRIKQIKIDKEHGKAIKQWQSTRGKASKVLLRTLEEEFGISLDLEKIENTLNSIRKGENLGWSDFKKAPGEVLFELLVLNRIFLGVFSVADAESARAQTCGESISMEPFRSEKARVRPPVIQFKDGGLNSLRSSFQKHTCDNASSEPGAYLIKAPTGLGKTFAAAKIIDKIERQKGICKVFYLAPTVTILSQVYDEFKDLVENGNLLEIHYMAEGRNEAEELSREDILERELKLDSWDAGMIITTYHRIISLFSNMSKRGCHNLYGLRNSIFILDECQFISHIQYPVFSSIISALVKYCGARVFFMSATPQDESMWHRAHSVMDWEEIPVITNLLHEDQLSKLEQDKMVNGRRTVHPKKDIVFLDDLNKDILNFCAENPKKSVLVLLNLAKDARRLYDLLAENGEKPDYCITTYLRPKDVRQNLLEAAHKLKDADERPILMIATSIVQAGVDLDFDAGFIELNDLATFRQGCGRVGRTYDYIRGSCDIFCFELIDDPIKRRPSWFRQRFGADEDLSEEKEIYLEVVKNSVKKVLNDTSGGLTDLEIESIEKNHVEEFFKIYDETRNKLRPGLSRYKHLLGGKSSEYNGFCFDVVHEILTDPLNEDDSVCPFLVLFLKDEIDEYSRINALISNIQELENKLLLHDESFSDSLKSYRKDKKRLQRLVAPFALRRKDILWDFKGNADRIIQMEDFYLHISNEEQYNPDSTGWQMDADLAESPGCII